MQICLIGLTKLGAGGRPLQVVQGEKRRHNALLRLVDGEVGAQGLVGLMMQRDHRHRQVRPI